ncbi:hypothetical protein D9615_005976 [Tricholomella constricta]|uniref:DUF2855 family protein n=1 Tax=Tricholomella constricta TaxID=117010 RepID=A0A8H5H987_9AGAR|nr:hypothetical protein D9615_005976 [Tricholomella constricta]
MGSMTDENLTLCVPRASSGQDPHQPVLASSQRPTQYPPNHVLIKVDRFGFSANNITYQALGEHPHFRYFDFNDAPEVGKVSPKTHGLFPVWGFGTVEKSTHPKIHEGERVYGYFAPTRYLLLPVSSADVNKHAFYVPRPHLPADRRPYNQILRCAADPQYTSDPAVEDLTMLYRPLFWTSYWCEDWLFSSNYRGGASTILISSASSKTAFCLAYLIKKRIARGELSRDVRIVGLTSKGNVDFTRGLGHYDEVLEYGSFTSGRAFSHSRGKERWIYVDVASNAALNERILAHFASPYAASLVACIVLGLTNLSPASPGADSIDWGTNTFDTSAASADARPSSQFWPSFENFFMPEWLDVRKHQLSIGEIFATQNKAWQELMVDCVGWVKMDRVYGGAAVRQAYEEVAKRGLGPERGLIWSLWDAPVESRGWWSARL